MKLATIRRRLATIGYAHRCAKHDSPADDPAVKATMAGIARTIGSVHSKKTALTAALVAKVVKAISADTVAGLLDRALLLLQFSAALRVSELVDLNVNDVARHSEGIVLTIKRSKTDQDGVGLERAVPHGKRLRPVAALDAWLSAARITEGPLFRTVRAGKVSKAGISLRTVSRMIKVPDNLKAGITKPSRYEPGVNRTYQDLADHYGFVVLPARVRRPRDKAKVEAAVGIVSRFVLGKLRNRRFFSLAELNEAVRDCVATINAKAMKPLKQSRNDLFASLDRPALKGLPSAFDEC